MYAGKSGGLGDCEEQIPPTVTWGSEYLVYGSYIDRVNDDTYLLIVSAEDNTMVQHNCEENVSKVSLNFTGDSQVFLLNNQSQEEGCYIESDKPILVSQLDIDFNNFYYIFLFILPSIDQYTNDVVFQTPSRAGYNESFETHFINIIMKDKDDDLRLDNNTITSSWTAISDFNDETVGYFIRLNLSPGVHTVYSPNDKPFNTLVYGVSSHYNATYSFSPNVGILVPQRSGESKQLKHLALLIM